MVGFMGSVVVLSILQPQLWMNLIILLVLAMPLGVFAVLWAVVGIGYFSVHHYQKRKEQGLVAAEGDPSMKKEQEQKPRAESGQWLRRVRHWGGILGILGLILALASILAAGKGYLALPPAENYVDTGIFSFVPQRVYSTQEEYQIKIAGSWKTRTRTVYVVEYYSTEGGYGYRQPASGKAEGNQLLGEGTSLQRRVLSLADTGEYITIPAHQTAASYTHQYQYRYMAIFAGGVLYLFAYGSGYYWLKQKRKSKGE